MFVLTPEEAERLLSQFVIAKVGRGGRRTPPHAFTEHGVATLSSVLNSERAVEMSVLIVRSFIRMRELVAANKDIAARVEKLERGQNNVASGIEVLVEDIDRLATEMRQITAPPDPPKRKIGFGV